MNSLSARQRNALERVQRKPQLQPFFFRELNGLHWFDELEARGFLKAENNPVPIETKPGEFRIPRWPILDYLENTAPDLKSVGQEPYSARYMEVIRDVTTHAEMHGYSNFHTWISFSRLLNQIHLEAIQVSDVELMKIWLSDSFAHGMPGAELANGFLPSLLASDSTHARDLALEVLRILTELTEVNDGAVRTRQRWTLPIEPYRAMEIFRERARSIGYELGFDGLAILEERVRQIISSSPTRSFSYIWRPAIEDHEQNRFEDEIEQVLIGALRDALLGHIERRAAVACDQLDSLLSSEEVILQRLAIYVIGQKHRALSPLVPQVLDERFFSTQHRHETFHFLHSVYSDLDQAERDLVLDIIARVAKSAADPTSSAGVQRKQESYEALRWLSAIKDSGCDGAAELYQFHLGVAGSPPEHPDLSSYTGSGWVGEKSPYSSDELLSLDLDELARVLSDFDEQPGWDSHSRRGLALTLKAAVSADPTHFEGNLHRFRLLPGDYVSMLLDAYRQLWEKSAHDNWPELLEFAQTVIDREEFWDHPHAANRESPNYARVAVVSSIAELIKAGTASDDRSFDPRLLDQAGRILSVLLERQPVSPIKDYSDAVTEVINHPRGQTIDAFVSYALRRCRLGDAESKSHEAEWTEHVLPVLESELANLDAGNDHFAAMFGMYLLHFLYMSEQWTLATIPEIFSRDRRSIWLAAVVGYGYVTRVDFRVYRALRERNQLINILDESELGRSTKDKIIDNVVIAYLHDVESLEAEGHALAEMIRRRRPAEIRRLAWLLWTTRKDGATTVSHKVLPIWSRINDGLDPREESHQDILSSLCMFVVHIEEFDELTARLLLDCLPYADVNHNSHIVVKEFVRLVGKDPEAVARSFLAMLSSFAPTYPKDAIQETISVLYRSGLEVRQLANQICDRYLDFGVDFPAQIRQQLSRDSGPVNSGREI